MGNDIYIIGTCLAIFILIGSILPFINEEFNRPDINASLTDLDDISSEAEDVSTISVWKVLGSIFKMGFWTFGDLPFVLDLFFIFIRIIFWLTLARNIWIGGGS